MKLLIFWSLLIHIFQVRSQEYDDSSDIADILKIKDFGSDSNDTIEENLQEVEESDILVTDLPLFDHNDANGNETITAEEDSNATNETSTDQPLLGVETTTFPQDLGKLEKKCNFKSTKTHYLHFQKWQKINFCTRKKFKTIKNAILGLKKNRIFGSLKLFPGAKIDFLPFLK